MFNRDRYAPPHLQRRHGHEQKCRTRRSRLAHHFGYNMFFFPFSKVDRWNFFRARSPVDRFDRWILTIILTVWLWRSESRSWVRNLGYAALAAVILQGVLGGLRVTMLKDEIGIFHACLAQAYLGLMIVIALVNFAIWARLSSARVLAQNARLLARISITTSLYLWAKLALGAAMRHEHRDLSILDFPFAYGKIIPDVSAEKLAAINTWRDAHALSDVTAFQIWAPNGTSLRRPHYRGWHNRVLVFRVRRCARRINRAEAPLELVGFSPGVSDHAWCLDDLEQQSC